jgi:hypothetical protein
MAGMQSATASRARIYRERRHLCVAIFDQGLIPLMELSRNGIVAAVPH